MADKGIKIFGLIKIQYVATHLLSLEVILNNSIPESIKLLDLAAA